MSNSDPFKFRPVEDVFSTGEPGMPGYTILTVFRGAFNPMRKNHTYTLTVTHFSGKVERMSTNSVYQVRKWLADYSASGTLNRPEITRTGV